MLKSLTDFFVISCALSISHLNIGNICEFLLVKVNILQLLTVYELQFIINDKTLHLLFSFTHWDCRSGSRHGHHVSSG